MVNQAQPEGPDSGKESFGQSHQHRPDLGSGQPGNEQEDTDLLRHPLNWPVSTNAPVQSRSFGILGPVRFILPIAAIIGFLALGKIPDFRATASWFMDQPSGSTEQLAAALPLGSSLRGVSNGISVLISGLPTGSMLTAGRPLGPNSWRLQVAELDQVMFRPPTGFAGAMDLAVELHLADDRVVDRRWLHLEWVRAAAGQMVPVTTVIGTAIAEMTSIDRATAEPAMVDTAPAGAAPASANNEQTPSRASQNSGTQGGLSSSREIEMPLGQVPSVGTEPAKSPVMEIPPALAPAPGLAPDQKPAASAEVPSADTGYVLRQLSPEQLNMLVKRGEDLIAIGDIAAARLLLERAAEARDPRAALALGTTYDPIILEKLRVRGLVPDIATARIWYQRAKEFGAAEASRKVETLGRRP